MITSAAVIVIGVKIGCAPVVVLGIIAETVNLIALIKKVVKEVLK